MAAGYQDRDGQLRVGKNRVGTWRFIPSTNISLALTMDVPGPVSERELQHHQNVY